MKKADVKEFFTRLRNVDPEPKSELEWKNPFTLVVAVVLSAQSTDKGVNKATHDLFKKVDAPEKMLKLGEAGLKKHIKTIGLFNTKAKNIIKLSQMLIDDHDGNVP
ncbi:MAG: endonuclease III, partial [Rhodospirillaceae bacterium]|nr:endonuclease III [Rhodospirillaceae bacterium]